MSRASSALAVGLGVAVAACGWLLWENRNLRQKLDQTLASSGESSGEARAAASGDRTDDDPTAAASGAGNSNRANLSRWLFRNRPQPPSVDNEPKKETREERRQRRQLEVEALFGRLDGETAEEYRERMVPFVENTLAGPRKRLADARQAIEEAAGVTEKQRAEMDEVFNDFYSEVVELTNAALETGDLTPYSRNWSGVLNFAGGVGAVLEGTETRIDTILTPEQRNIIYDGGFEWGEYLGVTAPWEQINAPPPPGS